MSELNYKEILPNVDVAKMAQVIAILRKIAPKNIREEV